MLDYASALSQLLTPMEVLRADAPRAMMHTPLFDAVGLALALTFVSAGVDPDAPFAPPSPSRLGKFKTAAVSSDGVPCSTIGR